MASLTIRRYERRDRDAVLRLHRNGLQQMNADLGVGPWDTDLDAIEETYLDGGGAFLVGELDEEVIAMAALRRVNEDTVEVNGYTRATADTSINQLPAQRLLAKLGFRETGRNIVRDLELICYERDLP